MNWQKGDILYAKKASDARHPIIFVEGHDDTYFIGGVLTHFQEISKNIPMKESHFCVSDKNGVKYEVCYDGSYLVKAKLLKRLDWLPFRKVGQLTDEGLSFINTNLKNQDPMVWEDYNSGLGV